MLINDDLILKLENLSRLALADDERQMIKQDLNNILAMVDKLQELDTDHVQPLVYLNEHSQNRLRADEVANELLKDSALRNAKNKSEDFFKVPRVK